MYLNPRCLCVLDTIIGGGVDLALRLQSAELLWLRFEAVLIGLAAGFTAFGDDDDGVLTPGYGPGGPLP